MTVMTEQNAVMTVGEVSKFLRVHPSTIYRLLKRGRLPAFRVGSDWRFRRSEMEKWLENGGRMIAESALPEVS